MSKYTVRLTELVEATAVFLFFYQALRVLFSVLFGLIYDALFAETGSLSTVGLLLVLVILVLWFFVYQVEFYVALAGRLFFCCCGF